MTLNLRELKQVGAKYREKRRGRRMNSRVQVKLEWESEGGKRHSLETNTRIVNPYGCMVVLEDSLQLEQRLALTNLATNGSNAAVVVWKGPERPEGWELGIELIQAPPDFWGVEL